ncbi:hypothetical protein J6590_035804 [Homalodisca vitripennis]|nr:hypothetical protein J6590_035804 [Homalodisca vitripennis]
MGYSRKQCKAFQKRIVCNGCNIICYVLSWLVATNHRNPQEVEQKLVQDCHKDVRLHSNLDSNELLQLSSYQ